MLRVAAFLMVSVLPGAWITFGLPLRQLAFWARLLTGVLLSPLVAGLEFYALRLLGASFAQTAFLLVYINLPAVYLIWKRGRHMEATNGRAWLAWSIAVVVSIACLMPAFAHPQTVMYRGHPWLYTEPVYELARGELILEDPDMAGFRMGYPVWGGLIHQAILSFLLDSPPMCSFIWTSLVCLIVACGFVMGLVEELGGGWLAKWSSGVWLLLGSNSVGYVLQNLLPVQFTKAVAIWGDNRYTPWVWKFSDFNSMPVILGMFAALVYLLIRQSPEKPTKDFLLVVWLLLCCIGVFYPILYPAACAILGAKALAVLLERSEESRTEQFKQIATLTVVLLFSAAVTYAHYRFLAGERIVAGMVQISGFRTMLRKALEYFVVTSPLLAGVAIVFLNRWKERRTACVVLVLGALGSFFLNAYFFLPYWGNEYKFVFTAIICLAPFPSLATEHVWKRLGPAKALPIAGLTLLFFAGAYAHKMYNLKWDLNWIPQPITDVRSFYLRLDPRERLSGIYDAARKKTPPNTILAIQNADWHPPTFTSRSLYVAYEDKPFSGVNQGNDVLQARIRGHGETIVKERRQTLVDIFESSDDARRAQGVSRLLELKRPVAIVLEPGHTALLTWLMAHTPGAVIYQGNGLTLWLIQPGPDSGPGSGQSNGK